MLRNYVRIPKPNKKRAWIHPLYIKRGSASGGREEGRAPSTAEEFTRQGVASQTVEKAYDGAAEAVNISGESEEEMAKVKEEIKKKEKGKDYHKPGKDDGGLPINTFKGT